MVKRIVVLVSGGGSNLQALIDAQHSGVLKSGGIVRVISSKPDAFALTRAARAGIETQVLCPGDYETRAAFDTALLAALADARADLVVLAGFLYVLGPQVVKAYPRRIINVHPYGLRVHRAALDYGVKVTGATVHFVNEITDGGQIILQKAVDVLEGDTPEILQKRVMEQAEWVLLPQAAELVCQDAVEER